ncbi:MAG: SDR family oxidoreductase [Leptospiraceae bacterium]|nr:SDR family oxidoreductase [Leptospiraceae bacterium]
MVGKSVIITGASSGIGKNLALEFASKGYSLGLTARRYELLKEVQLEIHEKFGKEIKVELRVLDVTIYRDVFRIIKELNYALGGLDILVANAGIAGSHPVGTGHFQQDKNVIETNVIGAIACVDATMEIYRGQNRKGQIVGISSVAGHRGFPGNGSYCASKAAFTAYLESLRMETLNEGIHVTTILPGFIDTPINSHMPNRPFVIDSKKGAKKIFKAIIKKKKVAYVPFFPWNYLGRLVKILPDFLFRKIK